MLAIQRGLPTLLTLITFLVGQAGASQPEGEDKTQSVCFNNCSGHGRCVDFACECNIGYDGDDCSFCYINGESILPILSAGDVNLTSSNFRGTLLEARAVLVAATSKSCHHCIRLELEYESATSTLRNMGVLVGRIDADVERRLLGDLLDGFDPAARSLPIIAFCTSTRQSARTVLYEGPHEQHAIVEFSQKQLEPPARRLLSVSEVESFIQNPRFLANESLPSTAVTVVGFFSGAGVMEEDEMEDFMEAATNLKSRCDVYFGVVDDATVCGHFKKLGWVLRASEAVLTRPGLVRGPSLGLWALLENNISVTDWIVRESVPLVGRLTNANFAQYERTQIPMLIMFLELPGHSGFGLGLRIGGKSGGVLNDDLVRELNEVAVEHRGLVSCLYADGIAFADSMKTLGLFGSRERLPQVAFNTMDGRQRPFPENLPINRETLLHFTAALLSGNLQSALDARKAMVVSRPFSTHNTVRRKQKRGAPTEIRGVSEQLRPNDAITQVTRKKFVQMVLGSDRDVLLMFHSKECERCSNIVPYYKRLGKRFLELGIPSVLVAAMDVTEETPPSELAITLPPLPAILLLPGDDKGPPFRFFSGVGKVGPLMRWFQKYSSTHFDLPVLPHLTEAEKPLFREQVRKREEQQASKAAKLL